VEIFFKAGFFTVAPSVVASSESGSTGQQNEQVYNITATSCSVITENSGFVDADYNFSIHVSRQGSDYKNIEKRVEREVSTFKEVIQEENDSMIRVSSSNGYGSTNTVIRRFNSLNKNLGSAIVYNDSATDGASFVVQESGIFSISYTDVFTTANWFGITVNSTELTTLIQTMANVDDRLSMAVTHSSGDSNSISWEGYLNKGDIVRPHCGNGGDFGSNDRAYFTMSKQGVPKIASVAPDSKIEIPTSELRMKGTTNRGSTDTAIVRFNVTEKIKGDAFTITSNATNGTYITINKDGVVDISSAMLLPLGGQIAITQNQTDLTIMPTIASEIVQTTYVNASARSNLSSSIDVKVGDVLRIASTVNPSAEFSNSLNITHQEQRIQVAISNIEPQFEDADSMVRLHTGNGHGSINNKIRRFSSLVSNIGSAINYTDSATDGAEFEILEDGFYSISYSDNGTSACNKGLSLNSTELTTFIYTINSADRLAYITPSTTDYSGVASWSGNLSKGDIIRAHTDGVGSSQESRVSFTIAKVGVPSIAEVDVTPFVNFHENRFQATEWESYTPATQGFGSISSVEAFYRRVGSNIEIKGRFTAGTISGATVAEIGLPNGLEVDSSFVSTISVGLFLNATSTIGATFGAIATAGDSYINFGNTELTTALTPSTMGALANNNDTVGFSATVPIEGWTSYEDNYERIYAVEQNENEFSARIANNGTASIVSQSLDFIESVNRSAQGFIDVTLKAGFFTEAPMVQAGQGGQLSNIAVQSITTSGFTIITRNDSGTYTDRDVEVSLSRQGADRKDLQKQLASISDFPRVNNQLSQSFNSNSGITRLGSGIIEVNPITVGDSLLTYDSTTGKFTCLRNNVSVNITSQPRTSAADNCYIVLNGVDVGQNTNIAGYALNASFSGILNKGDEIWSKTGGALSGTDHNFSMLAQVQELERVTNVDQQENVFSAIILNNGTASIDSENYEFIDNVNRSSTGFVTITFKAGFFTEPPSVTATAKSGSNVYVTVETVTTSSATVQIRNDGGTPVDTNFNLNTIRQGDDYKSLTDIVLAFPDSQVAYLNTDATDYVNDDTSASTSYKTVNLNSIDGDSSFVTIDSNQFTIASGKYTYTFPAGCNNGAEWLDVLLYNFSDTSNYKEHTQVAYGAGGVVSMALSPVHGEIEITSPKTFEFRTRSDVASGAEFWGRIKLTKLRQ
jgi:hypothetical protein